jgi:hypothetical protein
MWDSEKRKRKKYAPLVEAARQHNPAVVLWYAPVFTMQGLLGDETEEIIKIIMGGHAKMLARRRPRIGRRSPIHQVAAGILRDEIPQLTRSCVRTRSS